MLADLTVLFKLAAYEKRNPLPSTLLPSVGDVLVFESVRPDPSRDSPVSPLVLQSGPRTIPCFWTEEMCDQSK